MKTTVYYHIWTPGDSDLWKIMVDDQIKRLYVSGLPEVATIKCTINGAQASRVKQFVSLYDWINIIDETIEKNGSWDTRKNYKPYTFTEIK